ncbi:hypothetical protein IX39_04505 [Chryseobacterium formosense]|uniref:Uncharacterized protein n=1 Tax=Chryseobacterium formosense TaxID=236814 RepID=A0A085Z653_9FLAO|nr:hypothetical protein [Chryseobacterium formosense]KFE99916.1 hypothetical protein IX39_04505 [Chryseobacterium formosense]SFT59976.1 hypothetical protein SAMN05421857_1985 [Chryseobacterium formosense]
MKLYFILLFIFSFALFSAQNKQDINETQITSDSVSLKDKALLEQNLKDLETLKSNSKVKTETEESLAKGITIVQGIDRILNYKVNRVWREDLYCLVCRKNYSSREIA